MKSLAKNQDLPRYNLEHHSKVSYPYVFFVRFVEYNIHTEMYVTLKSNNKENICVAIIQLNRRLPATYKFLTASPSIYSIELPTSLT